VTAGNGQLELGIEGSLVVGGSGGGRGEAPLEAGASGGVKAAIGQL
jgi:hypothetical protein